MTRNKKLIFIILSSMLVMAVSSCATIRLDPSNRSEQVTLTLDKTI